jgi:hypothetical protein
MCQQRPCGDEQADGDLRTNDASLLVKEVKRDGSDLVRGG